MDGLSAETAKSEMTTAGLSILSEVDCCCVEMVTKRVSG